MESNDRMPFSLPRRTSSLRIANDEWTGSVHFISTSSSLSYVQHSPSSPPPGPHICKGSDTTDTTKQSVQNQQNPHPPCAAELVSALVDATKQSALVSLSARALSVLSRADGTKNTRAAPQPSWQRGAWVWILGGSCGNMRARLAGIGHNYFSFCFFLFPPGHETVTTTGFLICSGEKKWVSACARRRTLSNELDFGSVRRMGGEERVAECTPRRCCWVSRRGVGNAVQGPGAASGH